MASFFHTIQDIAHLIQTVCIYFRSSQILDIGIGPIIIEHSPYRYYLTLPLSSLSLFHDISQPILHNPHENEQIHMFYPEMLIPCLEERWSIQLFSLSLHHFQLCQSSGELCRRTGKFLIGKF